MPLSLSFDKPIKCFRILFNGFSILGCSKPHPFQNQAPRTLSLDSVGWGRWAGDKLMFWYRLWGGFFNWVFWLLSGAGQVGGGNWTICYRLWGGFFDWIFWLLSGAGQGVGDNWTILYRLWGGILIGYFGRIY